MVGGARLQLTVRDAAIWVLDEPTSALDPEAAAAVFGELPALLHTHEELMAREGEYAGLFRLQAAGYV